MSTSPKKLLTKVHTLTASISELDEKLAPLLSKTLPENLEELDKLQQVKLNVLLPYLVDGLIFVYLRTKGIDPKTHPVIQELDRVRQYFAKIKDAEAPKKPTTQIDKGAATRFIKHALASAQAQAESLPQQDDDVAMNEAGSSTQAQQASSSSNDIPIRITSKMRAREEYIAQLRKEDREGGGEKEVLLEVFDVDADADEGVEVQMQGSLKKGKGKAKAVGEGEGEGVEDAAKGSRPQKRRNVMDPWGGFGDSPSTQSSRPQTPDTFQTPQTTQATQATQPDQSQQPKKKKKKTMPLSTAVGAGDDIASSRSESPASASASASGQETPNTGGTKQKRKKTRKAPAVSLR